MSGFNSKFNKLFRLLNIFLVFAGSNVLGQNYTNTIAPFTSISSYENVDVSDSGQFMVGCKDVAAHLSTNYGTVWGQLTYPSSQNCEDIDINDSGSTIVITTQYNIYISTDTGATWSTIDISTLTNTSNLYRTIDIDSSGANIVFVNSAEIFTSTDTGATWSAKTNTLSGDIRDVASDDSGQYLSIASSQGVYISDDAGDTWTDTGLSSGNQYLAIATDGTGQDILAIAYNGSGYGVFLSHDRGGNWTDISSIITLGGGDINDLKDVNVSENGLFMVVFTEDGLFYSSDAGASWTLGGLNSASHQYTKLSVSSTGQYIITGGLSNNESSYVSQDYGVSFISPFDVIGFLANGDGEKQIIATGEYGNGVTGSQGGYIYTSEDAGQTLVTRFTAGNRKWSSLSASDNLVKVLATVNPTGADGGYIYTSSDSGATWTERTSAGQRNWVDSDTDNLGSNYIIADNGNGSGGYIYTSSDSGATWTERTSAGQRNWKGVSMNDDGTELVAINSTGYIYTSSDSGATWTERTSAGQRNWSDVDSDDSGEVIISTVSGGYVYISYDNGVSWTEQTTLGTDDWYRVTVDKTGSVFAVAGGGTGSYYSLYTSINGVTWQNENISEDWTTLSYSGNSKILYALSGRPDSQYQNTTAYFLTDSSPTLVTLSPSDNATDINTSSNLVITFSENVTIGTGNILIKKVSDNSTIESIAVSSGQVTGSGTTIITVDPSVTLTNSIAYYIEIPSTAFTDSVGNAFDGISGSNTWNFTTIAPVDSTPPTFTMQLYSDSGLSTPVTDNARLSVGTYYVSITANETLSAAPTISIVAEGTANDITGATMTSVSGNEYKYTYIITSDGAATGTVLADFSVSGTDSANNTANNVSPTNEGTKAVYTDTVGPSAPTSFIASVTNNSTSSNLSWVNPIDADFASVTIRRSTSAYPTSVTDGSGVAADITGTTRTDSGLSDGVYYYSIFAKDTAGNVSVRVTAIATIDTTAPILSTVTPVSTPTTDTTPDYTFTTNEAGTITYGGSCSSITTSATVGNNTITLSALSVGTYTNCTITLTDATTNASTALTIPSFTVSATSTGGGGGGSTTPVIGNQFCTGTLPTGAIVLQTGYAYQNHGWRYDSSSTGTYQWCSFKCPVSTYYTPLLNACAPVITPPGHPSGVIPFRPSRFPNLPLWRNIILPLNSADDSIGGERVAPSTQSFQYPFENTSIIAQLQKIHGAEAISQEIYDTQCLSKEGKPYYRTCELGIQLDTFQLFRDNVVCEGFFVKKENEKDYRKDEFASRKEVVGVAVKMRKLEGVSVPFITPEKYKNIYTDIGSTNEASWIQPVAETALFYNIISPDRKTLEPERNITRAEAYAVITKAICMETDTAGNETWQQSIHRFAQENSLTVHSWNTFDAERSITRQELFTLASKAADLAERTGGCDPKPTVCFLR